MATIVQAMIAISSIGAMMMVAAPAAAADDSGVRPGDEAMTCEQIAAELAPYGQQMMPNLQAMMASQAQLYQQGRAISEQRKAVDEALLPLAMAGAVDTTGASKRAYQAAMIAKQAKERAENEALANSPLAQQYKTQTGQVMAQAQQMQSSARIQRLMQLAQEKHCDKK